MTTVSAGSTANQSSLIKHSLVPYDTTQINDKDEEFEGSVNNANQSSVIKPALVPYDITRINKDGEFEGPVNDANLSSINKPSLVPYDTTRINEDEEFEITHLVSYDKTSSFERSKTLRHSSIDGVGVDGVQAPSIIDGGNEDEEKIYEVTLQDEDDDDESPITQTYQPSVSRHSIGNSTGELSLFQNPNFTGVNNSNVKKVSSKQYTVCIVMLIYSSQILFH
jgi:hypothetical protein